MYSFVYSYDLIIGFHKKLEALAKQKDCDLVGKWLRSIINHMYWSVASTPNGDAETMIVKWLSVMSMMCTLVTVSFSQTACMGHRSRKRSGLLDLSMNVALL